MKENPYAMRCSPLVNCNAFGWDVLIPEPVVVGWNGGTSPQDLKVLSGAHFAKSNFGHGIVTFHIGYTWHTPPGWSLMVGPLPNHDHGPFRPMSALIESDVLKYPFYPSVVLTAPGEYTIPATTPICRVFPVQIHPAIGCEPTIEAEPQDFAAYRRWQEGERRTLKNSPEFLRIKKEIPFQSGKLGWKRFYQRIAKYPLIRMKGVKKIDMSR